MVHKNFFVIVNVCLWTTKTKQNKTTTKKELAHKSAQGIHSDSLTDKGILA